MPDESIKEHSRSPINTRSKGVHLQELNLLNFAFFTDPTTVEQAKGSPECEDWKRAMLEEMQAHTLNQTWVLCDLPPNKNKIKAKWVFKTKRNENGDIQKFKARLVAKGCSQKYGIDYNETYSPVVRYTSIRFLIGLAAEYGLKIHQMDVTTAFLQGELSEEIYMDQNEEFNDGTQKVCNLWS